MGGREDLWSTLQGANSALSLDRILAGSRVPLPGQFSAAIFLVQ